MNRLVKLGGICMSRYASRSILANNNIRCMSSKKNDGLDNSDQEQIDIIDKNQAKYFENVKKSFENLQKGRKNESLEEKRSRLMYQSRKRGTSENGLLLSNFSAQFLPKATEKQLDEYDKIINNLHNEWDLYYWLTNAVEMPEEIKSSEIIQKMKKFCTNDTKQVRIVQPDLVKF
jgi:succinate dehydrogenase assembly factor 2